MINFYESVPYIAQLWGQNAEQADRYWQRMGKSSAWKRGALRRRKPVETVREPAGSAPHQRRYLDISGSGAQSRSGSGTGLSEVGSGHGVQGETGRWAALSPWFVLHLWETPSADAAQTLLSPRFLALLRHGPRGVANRRLLWRDLQRACIL
jgi:hypothetical protein